MIVDYTALAGMPRLTARYRAGEFSASEYAASYVLVWQLARHGRRFALRRSRRDPKPEGAAWLASLDELSANERTAGLIDFLQRYDLREIRRRVNVALIGWLTDKWRLTLCEKIPSVREVLRLQARGTRPVTVIADYPRLLEPVREKPDAFAFVCHDLEHAWQFFHDPACHGAQRCFAQRLERAVEQGLFAPYVGDPVFAEKLDYLAADMNTHVAHSFQYLRAILVESHLRAEGKGPRAQLSPQSCISLDRCLEYFSARSDLPAVPTAALNSFAMAVRS